MRSNNQCAALLFAAIFAFSIPPAPGFELAKPRVTASATLRFDRSATGLTEDQRNEIFRVSERVRTWCALEVAIVFGYAGQGEATVGERKRLAEARTASVAELLKLAGISSNFTYAEAKSTEPWPFGVVELEFSGVGPLGGVLEC